jgi:hypothetical protein
VAKLGNTIFMFRKVKNAFSAMICGSVVNTLLYGKNEELRNWATYE